MALLAVDDALALILDNVGDGTGIEVVAIDKAYGRVLAYDLQAKRTQPPVDMSAMDGYALRFEDITTVPTTLSLIGESAAGHLFDGTIQRGTCVRIFTGAPVPVGADTVVVQENCERKGDDVTIINLTAKGRHIRDAGIDFKTDDTLLYSGTKLRPVDIALVAAMNHAQIPVRKQPRIGILATGDELVPPGGAPLPHQIISSNNLAVAAMAREAGAEVFDLGIAPDALDALNEKISKAQDLQLDILITLGGASVGDHDLVQKTLNKQGVTMDFWRIAMRPGKPMMFGVLPAHEKKPVMRVLGLPGNPVASYICALIFLKPLIAALAGCPNHTATEKAILGSAIKANDMRQDYLRAHAVFNADRLPIVAPFLLQDSSILSSLAQADVLIIREPYAESATAGDFCRIIRLK